MKRLISCSLVCLLAASLTAQSLSNLWVQAEAALAKDQPKTALTILSDIYTNAIAQEAWGDALAAAERRVVLLCKQSGGPCTRAFDR